jgi:hypothetical protein
MQERVHPAALVGCELSLELIVSRLPDDDVEEFENAHDCDRCSASSL